MKTALTMRRLKEPGPLVPVCFAGEKLALANGRNLAAELLAAGVIPFRESAVFGSQCNPYCMMGACFGCLVEIEGVVRQACMTEVTAGMIINRTTPRKADNA